MPGPTVYISHFSRFSVFLAIFHFLPCEFLNFLICLFSRHITGPSMFVSHFLLLSVFSTYSRSYSFCVSFSTFFRFLTLFQVLECTFFIFDIFDSFSQYFRSCNVFFSFSTFFCVSRHIPIPTMWVSHFLLSVFSLYVMSYTVLYHFLRFSVFLAIFQDLPCEILIFIFCQFSRHIPGPTVCVSHFPGFLTFLAICQVLEFTFIIFHVFLCFSPYSRSYHVSFSISSFVSFLTILQVLRCVSFSTFPPFSSHIPGPTMWISHFPRFSVFSTYSRSYSVFVSFSMFYSVSHHIPGLTVCLSLFPRLLVFLPYASSYSIHLSFFTFFSVSRHIPGPNIWDSHFHLLSVFWTYFRSYSVYVSYSTFFSFLTLFQVL